jgi:hypothetical protein
VKELTEMMTKLEEDQRKIQQELDATRRISSLRAETDKEPSLLSKT